MAIVVHIQQGAPAPPASHLQPRQPSLQQHADIFSPDPQAQERARVAQKAHYSAQQQSIFRADDVPRPRQVSIRNASDPFRAEASAPRHTAPNRLQRSDLFGGELPLPARRQSRAAQETTEAADTPRHMAPARDLSGRAGIPSERLYHVYAKGRVEQPARGDEVYAQVRGRRHVEPGPAEPERRPRVNADYQRSNLYAADDVPAFKPREAPVTCLGFTEEAQKPRRTTDQHARESDVLAFQHSEPIWKKDCTQPSQYDLRCFRIDEAAAQQAREESRKVMLQTRKNWQGW